MKYKRQKKKKEEKESYHYHYTDTHAYMHVSELNQPLVGNKLAITFSVSS